MKIVTISDTHCQLDEIVKKFPMEGDLLLHAGDLTYRGNLNEMPSQLYALGQLAKKFKRGCIFVCGNHDWLGEKDPSIMKALAEENNLTWLQDNMVEVEGVKIYGSAYTPAFCNWAFATDPYGQEGADPEKVWGKIPEGVDILLTHGPSRGNLDHSYDGPLGCRFLGKAIERVKPKAHIFGHIHHAYGRKIGADGITYVNASICNEQYDPMNPPTVIEWPLI